MPTPPLPVLHALLTALSLPRVLYPSSLGSVPPALLLLVFECLLARRLPLPSSLRSPRTRGAEIELTKIVLGSLADDILALDLAVVDPARLVDGSEPDIAVVIMALAVAARRRGIAMRLPSEVGEDECDISWESLEGDKSLLDAEADEGSLQSVQPLQPVRSPPISPSYSAFTTPPCHLDKRDCNGLPRDYSLASSTSASSRSYEWTAVLDPLARTPSPRRTPSPEAFSPWPATSPARKTVLQSMVEEFGLSPT